MDIRKIRNELQQGRSIYDLPLRVTFYARVSTDMDAQLNSLENQVQYYTEYIQGKENWAFVPGYIDEGISGTSTKNRDAFLRMIEDAKSGLFDFIITKETSRFSRSTLDSILYTQELLSNNVGVLFQNDNINTLDLDSEFRLTVMAGVAQDESRKLSQRLKFGFRQAIRNGHVLGNDRLYGYDKEQCVLTINEFEAEIIRTIFDLYANHGLGTRRISQRLLEMGYTSRMGNAFNTLTIRHILTNPKYKGWYCGNKTQTVDYRTKKKVFLDESEWITYPDPAIPAIVSEELWDRANALYKARRRDFAEHASGAVFHNRYPYSGKIFCQAHDTVYHRQTLKNNQGVHEIWQCKIYRNYGRSVCSAPQVWSRDLDQVLAKAFKKALTSKQEVADYLMAVLEGSACSQEQPNRQLRVETDLVQINQKKDGLLDLSIAGAIDITEFKKRNDAFNNQIKVLEQQLEELRGEKATHPRPMVDAKLVRKAIMDALSFHDGIDSALVACLLEKAVVLQDSTKEKTHLALTLRTGKCLDATIEK